MKDWTSEQWKRETREQIDVRSNERNMWTSKRVNDWTGEGWNRLEWVAPEAPSLHKHTGLKRLRHSHLRYAIRDAFGNTLLNIGFNEIVDYQILGTPIFTMKKWNNKEIFKERNMQAISWICNIIIWNWTKLAIVWYSSLNVFYTRTVSVEMLIANC